MSRFLLYFLILCCTASASLSAQSNPSSVSIQLGPDLGLNNLTSVNTILSSDEKREGYAVIQKGKKMGLEYDYFLTRISSDLNLASEMAIDLGDGKQAREFRFAALMNENIQVFSAGYDRKSRTINLFAQTYSAASLEMVEPARSIMSIALPKGSEPESAIFGFSFMLDESRSHLLVSYNPDQFIQLGFQISDPAPSSFAMFNTSLQLIWILEDFNPIAGESFAQRAKTIGEDGEVFLALWALPHRGRSRKGEVQGKDQVWRVGKDGKAVLYYAINNEDGRKIDHLKMVYDSDDHSLTLSAFYRESKDLHDANGVYFLRLRGADATVEREYTEPFTAELTAGQQNKRTREPVIEKLSNVRFIRGEGQQMILIGEQSWIHHITASKPPLHYAQDIVAIGFNPSGEVAWRTRIQKNQMIKKKRFVNNPDFSSYFVCTEPNGVRFLFNDHRDNKGNRPEDKRKFFRLSSSEANIVSITVDEEGHQHRQTITNKEESHVFLRPDVGTLLNSNNVLLFGHHNGNHRFLLLPTK